MISNDRIIEKSAELFKRFGINSVGTDDISTNLGISKRTFYQHFVSKEELVRCVTEQVMSDASHDIDTIIKQSVDSISEAIAIWDLLVSYDKYRNPNFLPDLERYYFRAWDMVETFKRGYLTSVLIGNLEKGIRNGCYRADMNKKVVTTLWLDLCQLRYQTDNAGLEIKHHFIRGLLTVEGIKQYGELCKTEATPQSCRN